MPRRRRSWPATLSRLLFDVVTLAGVAVTSRSRLAAETCANSWHSTKSATSNRDGRRAAQMNIAWRVMRPDRPRMLSRMNLRITPLTNNAG
jgi:hypothetical protein